MDLNLLRKMAGIPTQSTTSVTATNSTANEFRKLAGLNPLPVKDDSVSEGTHTRLNTYRVKDKNLIDELSIEDGAEMELVGDVGILTVDTITYPELARKTAQLAQQKKIQPIAGPATRDITGKAVPVGKKYITAPSPRDVGGMKEAHDKETEEEQELPEIVTKIAAKVEGMKGDEIVELIKKVYDAGVADGQAACEEGDVKEGIVDRVKAMISKPPQQMRTPEPKPRDTFIDSITNFVSPYGYKRVRSSNRAYGIGEWRNPNTGGIIEFNEDPDSMGYIIAVRGGGMRGYYWGSAFEKEFQKDFAKLHKDKAA